MKSLLILSVFLSPIFVGVSSLDNGLSLTPPMGWLTWERFRCNIDCENDPENCISEHLMKVQAQQMLERGYLAAGYDTIIVDDCWLATERDKDGKLQPDAKRFPSGIKALADYIHSLGLKFGIYEDFGNLTCGGYPGILGHLETDANTFAEWGVDYTKIDGCYVDIHEMDTGYPEFGGYLNDTDRPMVYSCSWPAYWVEEGETPDYSSIEENCNLWRNYNDIQDSWASVLDIINFYGDNKDDFAKYAGPGHWNDPDMLIIGNFGLSLDQSKVQMALWAIFASPLIMSNDLRSIKPEFEAILLNRNVIKINQDPLGIQGRRVFQDKGEKVDIFVRPIMPSFRGNLSAAVAVLYHGDDGTPTKVTFTLASLGLTHESGYLMSEAFSGSELGTFTPTKPITVFVNPSGVGFYRFDVNPTKYVSSWINEIESQFVDFDGIKIKKQGRNGWRVSNDEF